ncbi:MAG TPA: hypothetical protein VK666_21265 [Chryseolinea sp.]|nr:hypothetical protein [Chryseolinea sp.]
MITWTGSPQLSTDIQWRISTENVDAIIQYWIDGKHEALTTTISKMRLDRRVLNKDRLINRFTGHFDAVYFYQTIDTDGENLNCTLINNKRAGSDEFVLEKKST